MFGEIETNSTSSGTIQVSDNSYRVGLSGGQTYNTATADNDAQNYLGADTVNDIYYYDRTRDSSPEVQVELGIDPNISYIDMPEDIRNNYQYFTEADMSKLIDSGYTKPFHTLEEGVKDYVQNYLIGENYY